MKNNLALLTNDITSEIIKTNNYFNDPLLERLFMLYEDYEVFKDYKHNMYYYDLIKNNFNSTHSVLFTHTMGAGKTYTGLQTVLHLTRTKNIKNVLVMGSSIEVLRTWKELFSSKGSDSKLSKALPLSEGTTTHAFTNSDGEKEILSFSWEIFSYQKMFDKQNYIKPNTLVILDEVHHLLEDADPKPTKKPQNKEDEIDQKEIYDWTNILKEAKENASFVLGLTATPITRKGDVGEYFGAVTKGISFSDAQSDKHIGYIDDDPSKGTEIKNSIITSKLKIYSIPIVSPAFRENASRIQNLRQKVYELYFDPDTKERRQRAIDLAFLDSVATNFLSIDSVKPLIKDILTKKPHKIIAFIPKGGNVEKYKTLLNLVTGISTSEDTMYYINASTKSNERDHAINSNDGWQNKNKDTVLFNYDVISEGLHLDGVTGIFYFKSTESPVKFLQNIGRGVYSTSKQESVPVIDLGCNIPILKNSSSPKNQSDIDKLIDISIKSLQTLETIDKQYVKVIERILELELEYYNEKDLDKVRFKDPKKVVTETTDDFLQKFRTDLNNFDSLKIPNNFDIKSQSSISEFLVLNLKNKVNQDTKQYLKEIPLFSIKILENILTRLYDKTKNQSLYMYLKNKTK